jgi:murein L,D-transpeptidase YafK
MPRLTLYLLLLLPSAALADDGVPAWLLRLPDSTPTVFVAETSTSTFHRFDKLGGVIARTRQDYMSIGKGGVGKERVGDRRTPLGIYFITEQLDTTRLHEKYGVTAFPLDYPNAWDRRLGRTGDGIWVHGVDPHGGARPALDTDGCIALPNERLLELEDSFAPNVTPVLIGAEIAWTDAATQASTSASLESAVRRWASALEQGDMVEYLGTYDDAFEHWEMGRDEWSAFSLQTVGLRPITGVTLSELLLLADPAEPGLYLSRFRLVVTEQGGREMNSMRRIYWRRSESGAFRIVAEDSG